MDKKSCIIFFWLNRISNSLKSRNTYISENISERFFITKYSTIFNVSLILKHCYTVLTPHISPDLEYTLFLRTLPYESIIIDLHYSYNSIISYLFILEYR